MKKNVEHHTLYLWLNLMIDEFVNYVSKTIKMSIRAKIHFNMILSFN